MKMTSLAGVGLLLCLLTSGSHGKDLEQPLSVRPIGFNYNYLQDGTAIPALPNDDPIVEPLVQGPIVSTQTIGTALVGETAAAVPAAAPVTTASAAAGSCAPPAAAPACGAPAPACGAPAPAPCGCGPAAPSCDTCAPAPACDTGCAPAPSCGAPAPSCCAPAPSCGAPASCCDPCGGGSCLSGCGGLGLCDCDLGDAFTLSGAIHGDCPPCVNIGGWFSAGYHSKGNDLFNSRPDQFALHQGWLFAEKAASCESRIGFRADIMYGLDADDTQSFGNNPGRWDFDNGFDFDDYGWAIPQLYADFYINDTWSVKAGHFYTLIGYEVVTAPDNFFYSHAMTMYNSEPFTHTGVLATGAINDDVTVYAGWTLGWDTGFDQFDQGSSWLGGFSLTLTENASFTYISTAGNFGARGRDAYSHSLLLDMSLTDNLNWVVQSDMVRVNATGEDNVGLNQYLLYTVSDCLGLGARMEWWKADTLTGYAPHGGTLPASGSFSYYAATVGANIRPHANFVLRPELRIDWSPAVDYDEAYFGIDAIFTF